MQPQARQKGAAAEETLVSVASVRCAPLELQRASDSCRFDAAILPPVCRRRRQANVKASREHSNAKHDALQQ